MALPFAIPGLQTTQASAGTSVFAPGKGEGAGNPSGEAGSLFAALLALTGPNAETSEDLNLLLGSGDGELNPGDPIAAPLAQLATLLHINLATPQGEAATGLKLEGAGALQADLFDRIDQLVSQLSAALQGGGEADPEQLANLTALINGLTSDTKGAAIGALQQAPGLQIDGKTQPQKLDAAFTFTPEDIAAALKGLGGATSTDGDADAQQQATLPRLLATLAETAKATNPDLSAQITKLAETVKATLQNLTAPAANTADTPEAQLSTAIAAVLGDKSGRELKSADNPGMRNGLHVSDLAATKATTAPGDAPESILANQAASTAKSAVEGEAKITAKSEAQTLADMAKPDAPVKSTGDLLLQAQASTSQGKADMAAPVRAMTAVYQGPQAHVNIPHVAVEMARQIGAGATRFQIRLDPPEMGKIDVNMKVDGQGHLHARLTVERAETLDLLQRDARALERALAQSGLDSSKTNLEFSLKQNPFARQDQGQGFAGNEKSSRFVFEDEDGLADNTAAIVAATSVYSGYVGPGGVNMLA